MMAGTGLTGLVPASVNKTIVNGEVFFQSGKRREVDAHRLSGGKCPACVDVSICSCLHLSADVHTGIRAGEQGRTDKMASFVGAA